MEEGVAWGNEEASALFAGGRGEEFWPDNSARKKVERRLLGLHFIDGILNHFVKSCLLFCFQLVGGGIFGDDLIDLLQSTGAPFGVALVGRLLLEIKQGTLFPSFKGLDSSVAHPTKGAVGSGSPKDSVLRRSLHELHEFGSEFDNLANPAAGDQSKIREQEAELANVDEFSGGGLFVSGKQMEKNGNEHGRHGSKQKHMRGRVQT